MEKNKVSEDRRGVELQKDKKKEDKKSDCCEK